MIDDSVLTRHLCSSHWIFAYHTGRGPTVELAYTRYCFADPHFYDPIERRDDAHNRFALTHRSAPEGWSRFEQGVWVVLYPHSIELPQQGWKIHISTCLDQAEDALGIAWDYCVGHNIGFKFLRSRDILLVENSKYADRTSSGKFLTLYPPGETELHAALTELAAALAGYQGPYILSDLRWDSGPVHVRYGSFFEQYCPSADGDLVRAVATPDGRLVPDLRRPGFNVPSWVEIPDFLTARIAARSDRAPRDFPYEIDRALHFSNGGGIYLAQNRRTGGKVVLKEARPFAGLEWDGTDAVARLERERSILEQLSDLEFIPRLIEYVTCWEHHFLVEEYIDGEPLNKCMIARYPLVRPDPPEDEVAAYTDWALDVLGQVQRALEALHHRGIVFGDLHPRNIILRPDGRVALVDFEEAFPLDQNHRPGIGAPGFTAPAACSGYDIDLYALACLRLWMFLPLNYLLHLDPTKIDVFVRVLTTRFGVARTFASQVQRGLKVVMKPQPQGEAGQKQHPAGFDQEFDQGLPEWDVLRKSMTEALLASATPQRSDRLFPGDVAQFRYGGFTFAHGAAGVLYALETTGGQARPEHVDWLVRATRQARSPHTGLFNGLHGVAYVLDRLGRRDEALTILDRAMALIADVRAQGLFAGLAGIGLTLLYFAQSSRDSTLLDSAMRITEQLSDTLRNPNAVPDQPSAAGLMYGFSGVALLFIHLYETTTDDIFLDMAATALRKDLAYCQTTDDGRLEVRKGRRMLPYLATGSAGIGLVINEYLHHRHDEEFITAQTGLRRACRAEFVSQPGLFNGRAGLIAYLSHFDDTLRRTSEDSALDLHVHRLIWHAVPYQDHLGFVGDQQLRLSMDLATGSAGILLALHSALYHTDAALPFLHHRPFYTQPPRDEGGETWNLFSNSRN
ncbi:MAG: class III lanthionine synthetase LanKC [Pseudonocardiaceae bacterium]